MRADDTVLEALAALRSDDVVEIPSRRVLSEVTDHLIKALFPQRFGTCGPDVNGYVAPNVESALGTLSGEVATELAFHRHAGKEVATDPDELITAFANTLPRTRDLLGSDIQMAYEVTRRPAVLLRSWSATPGSTR